MEYALLHNRTEGYSIFKEKRMKVFDTPTFPENGIIYEGDYYLNIPYHLYISKEDLPAGPVFDIREYGATTEAGVLSTEAIQKALDAAEGKNGVVLVSGGAYTCGTLSIHSGTTLYIAPDSSINASKNLSSFTDAFIKTVDSENVTICGGGRINANGEYFVYLPHERPLTAPLGYTKLPPVLTDPMGSPSDTSRFKYRERIRYAEDKWKEGKENIQRPMYTLWIRGSRNVDIHNIIIRDSLDWSLSVDMSENVKIENIIIDNNRHVANTDGIDIMSSKHVSVKHVFISTADDGLCVKAPMVQGHDSINVADEKMPMGPAEDITIEDATVISVMNAFKIGTETYFDIKNVRCRNCTFMLPDIFPGGVSGISIESADGSHISDIQLENITMKNIAVPVFISLCRRNKFGYLSEEDRKKLEKGGSVSNITIENIKAEGMESSCIITGFKDEEGYTGKVKNITIKDFSAEYLDNEERLEILPEIRENIKDYPESNALGDMPSYGFYIRHADNVTLKNVNVKPRSMNTREMIVSDDADNLTIN